MLVYPMPFEPAASAPALSLDYSVPDYVRVVGAAPDAVLSLYSQQGRRLRQATGPVLEIGGLPRGSYLLRVQQEGLAVRVLRVGVV